MFEITQNATIVAALLAKPRDEKFRPSFKPDADIVKDHYGVPSTAQVIELQKPTIYRHYLRQAADADLIIKEGFTCAKVPYVQKAPGSTIYWPDLTGLFLTDPLGQPHKIGVPGRKAYLDIDLPLGIQLLYLEKGIYLLPMARETVMQLPENIQVGEMEP